MIDAMKGTILLVDDDKFLVDMYGMKFTASDFTVQICLSGKEALEVLKGGLRPSAILFDITMPEMDGFEFLKAVTDGKLAEGALKIALTNQSSDPEKAKAMEGGATHYIIKASMIPSEVVNTVVAELGKQTHKG